MDSSRDAGRSVCETEFTFITFSGPSSQLVALHLRREAPSSLHTQTSGQTQPHAWPTDAEFMTRISLTECCGDGSLLGHSRDPYRLARTRPTLSQASWGNFHTRTIAGGWSQFEYGFGIEFSYATVVVSLAESKISDRKLLRRVLCVCLCLGPPAQAPRMQPPSWIQFSPLALRLHWRF